MKRRHVITAALTLGICVTSHAQVLDRPNWAVLPQIDLSQLKPINDAFGNQAVAGKPFSATEERHSVQTLGNGTRIENTRSNRLYRDNDGRTRAEDMNGLISIADPVAGFRVELDPKTKVARRSPFLTLSPYGTAVGVFLAGIRGRGATTAGIDSTPGRGAATAGATEDLGAQMVGGVWAQGTRTTTTIPKGQIGNDREIKVVTEQWFSTDLNLLVKSVNSDPRFGDTTYQLTKVVQAPPDASLFQIPPDYTIVGIAPGQGRGQILPGGAGGRGGRGAPGANPNK
jgi:hypothetical protein